MNRIIKVGIAGMGRAGRFMHVPELLKLDDRFSVVAVCDREPERLRDLPEGLENVRTCGDFSEFVR